MEKTIVVFRVFHGEVLALFPEDPGTNDPATCNSYQHIGQHGAAHYAGCIKGSRPATVAEFSDLAGELTRIGYDLEIRERATHAMHAKRYSALMS